MQPELYTNPFSYILFGHLNKISLKNHTLQYKYSTLKWTTVVRGNILATQGRMHIGLYFFSNLTLSESVYQ